jgi:hypothetical protein
MDHHNHEDRSALLLKLSLREALRRVRLEGEQFNRLETLAGNLGWEEVAESARITARALGDAGAGIERGIAAATSLQAEAKHGHEHPHPHESPAAENRDGGE